MHKFAQEFTSRNEKLHVLVNNAGEFAPEDQLTEDGFEVRFVPMSARAQRAHTRSSLHYCRAREAVFSFVICAL